MRKHKEHKFIRQPFKLKNMLIITIVMEEKFGVNIQVTFYQIQIVVGIQDNLSFAFSL